MKLGCMTYSLGRALADKTITLPQALELIRELGAEGVDIMGGHASQYTPTQLKQMVAEAGLVIASYIGGADLTMSDPEPRAQALEQLRRGIDQATEVEAKTVLFTTGVCAQGQDRAEGRRNVAAGLSELLPSAKAAGIILSIEDFPHPLSPHQTSEECLECCQLAGPELRITYDTGNMVMSEEDPVDFLQAVKHLVVHAHAKDWQLLPPIQAARPEAEERLVSRSGKRYQGQIVGQGVLDYPAIIKALKQMDYQGFLSFEYEGPGDPIAAARQGMAYLQHLLQEG